MKVNTPDRYDIEARYVPALIGSVPFLFFGHYFIAGLDGAFWQSAFTMKFGAVGLSTALYLVAIHFCRTLGKVIEEKWFQKGLAFPTTDFLLSSDTNLSRDRKTAIKQKVTDQFSIELSATMADTTINRQKIHEAVGQIRYKFYKKNHLVQQRNIQYGATRNLLAASIVAAVVAAFGALLSWLTGNNSAFDVALVLLCLYGALMLFSAISVRFTARQFAHTLFNEFLAS